MALYNVMPGDNAPDEFNVIIEIPAHSDPIKYEVDKDTGALFVDRFMMTSMHYPCNYGYIPGTISDDGDPVDVLVVTPFPVHAGAVVQCRALGLLEMEDEAGGDAKLLAVPIDKILPIYKHWKKPEDLQPERLLQSSTSLSTTRTSRLASGSRSRAGRAPRRHARRSFPASLALPPSSLPTLAAGIRGGAKCGRQR
ncbi:MAG: hypothetical protein RIS59_191 [Pseudomonadota bacterium]